MNNLFLYLLLSIAFCFNLNAQSKADAIVEEANKLKEIGKLSLANTKLKAAADMYKKEGKFSLYIKCAAEQGKNLLDNNQKSDAIRVLEALIREAENIQKAPDENMALAYKYLGSVFYKDDDLVKATPYFVKALELREKANPKSEDLFRDNYNLGVMYRNLGNNAAAIKYLNKAIELQLKNPNPAFLSKIYLQLGISYKLIGSFTEAEDYLDIAIKFAEEGKGTDSKNLAVYFMEKGAIVREASTNFESMKKALSQLNKALLLFEKSGESENYNYAVCLNNIGQIYLYGTDFFYNEQEESNSALKAFTYFDKALKLNRKNQPKSIAELNSLINISMSLVKSKDYEKANIYLSEAEKLAKLILPVKHLMIAEILSVKGEMAERKGEWNKALEFYTNTIVASVEDYFPKTQNDLPNWNLAEDGKVLSLNKLKDFIALKARTFFKKYKESKDVKDLELALSHLQYVDKIADKIRADFTSEGGKMVVSDMIIDAYEIAISVCLELSKVKKDAAYKEKAFYFSEKSKCLVLLEAFQNSKAAKLAGLSDAAVKEEENLRLSITDLKQQIYQLKTRGEGQSAAFKQLEKDLFSKKQAYSAYVKRIGRENPEYYAMKFDIKLLDVAQTRKLLKKDQALLEYFVGNKLVFVFKITADDFQIYELPGNENLAKTVKNFRESIYGYHLNEVDKNDESFNKYAADYAKYGSELYDNLIKPLGTLPKKLIIVPAGPLSNMPFEPLLKSKPTDPKLFKTHKYLGMESIISYNYSATLLSEMINKKHSANRESFLGFAPSFGADNQDGVTMRNRRFALAPLNYNDKEIQKVQKILGTGKVYVGKEALESIFRKNASNYQIIHFATHGMANDRDPDFSLLAFTEIPDSIENEFLYVSDLYNIKLNADLVVLSACETGLGELRKGEGVISLARGFSYAGAKGIFTTLWSVNDMSTSMIIESFYKYLKQGKDKDEALHLAKLDFLKQVDNKQAHPFLWAPYIFIGDTSPLKISSGFPWIYIAIGSGIVLLLGLGYFVMKKSKKQAALPKV